MSFKPGFLVVSILAFFQSCCVSDCSDGKKNPTRYGTLPTLGVYFNNYSSGNFKVVIYTIEYNTIIDSTIFTGNGYCYIAPYKARGANIEEVRNRKYVVKHQAVSDTIYNMNCRYGEWLQQCDKCKYDDYMVGQYGDFSFEYKNNRYTVNSLTLNY